MRFSPASAKISFALWGPDLFYGRQKMIIRTFTQVLRGQSLNSVYVENSKDGIIVIYDD